VILALPGERPQRLCECLSVWCIVENGLLDLAAGWCGESAGSNDEASTWGWRSPQERDNFGVDITRPIVTNGEFVAQLCKGA